MHLRSPVLEFQSRLCITIFLHIHIIGEMLLCEIGNRAQLDHSEFDPDSALCIAP